MLFVVDAGEKARHLIDVAEVVNDKSNKGNVIYSK